MGEGLVRGNLIATDNTTFQVPIMQPAFEQMRKDKVQLQDIAIKLESFVAMKKNLMEKYTRLQLEMKRKEQEHAAEIEALNFKHKNEIRASKTETVLLTKAKEEMKVRLNSRYESQRAASENYKKVCEERKLYEKQLTDCEQMLTTEKSDKIKLTVEVQKLTRSKNSLQDQIVALQTENKTIISEKLMLEKSFKGIQDDTLKNQKELEKLKSELMENTARYKEELSTQRLAFDEKSRKQEEEYNKQLENYYQRRAQLYDKDKKHWMKIFREEVETKMRAVAETNTDLKEASKKLGAENDQLQATIAELRSTMATEKSKHERTLASIREKSIDKVENLIENHKLEISRREQRFKGLVQEKENFQTKLDALQKKFDQKQNELQRTKRRMQNDYDNINNRLRAKEDILRQMQSERVDYFQEINALQQVLNKADESGHISDESSKTLLSEIRKTTDGFLSTSETISTKSSTYKKLGTTTTTESTKSTKSSSKKRRRKSL